MERLLRARKGWNYKEGNLIIESAEAEVVKRIYREYLEGACLLRIGCGLEADGILTGAEKTKWRPETLKKILKNESTSEMPFCKRPITLISSIKSGCRTRGLSLSNMWKTGTSQLFSVIFICRCRRK